MIRREKEINKPFAFVSFSNRIKETQRLEKIIKKERKEIPNTHTQQISSTIESRSSFSQCFFIDNKRSVEYNIEEES